MNTNANHPPREADRMMPRKENTAVQPANGREISNELRGANHRGKEMAKTSIRKLERFSGSIAKACALGNAYEPNTAVLR